ncbi:MAG: hypothetical protein ACYCZR_06115 [Burkholderiales bacterium]
MSREHIIERKDSATRQLATIAKLMALHLDPGIPAHAELLEAFERAMFRLREESKK